MFSSKVMNDESNEAASLTMIKVIKDKDEARAKDNQGKSGDITERLAALSREIDKVSAPSPSPASVPINSADSSHGSPPAQSSAEPLAASPQTDQDRTGKNHNTGDGERQKIQMICCPTGPHCAMVRNIPIERDYRPTKSENHGPTACW